MMCEVDVETMLMGDHQAVCFSCKKTGKPFVFTDLTGDYCEDMCGHQELIELFKEAQGFLCHDRHVAEILPKD